MEDGEHGLQDPSIREVVHHLQAEDMYCLNLEDPGGSGARLCAPTDESATTKPTGASGRFKDDITGQVLLDSLVGEAQAKELAYFDTKNVWTLRPRSECFDKTGKKPITVRWVLVNKGDDQSPNYRARLVARQMRHQGVESIFAPTPPLEAIRTVLSLAATRLPGDGPHSRDPNSKRRIQVSFLDISRAYFNAPIDKEHPTFVELPPEHPQHGTAVAQLNMHMYGTLRAADGWQEEYSCTLVEKLGFIQGMTSPCIFSLPSRGLVCAVHGDDFTTRGPKEELDWMTAELRKYYELTDNGRIGPGATDDKQATVLNRVVTWTDAGLLYEADPRQGEKLLHELGLEGSNSTATPGLRATSAQLADDKPLQSSAHTLFRGSSARANYLSADRPDVLFSAKEVCRFMSAPTDRSLGAIKRLGRFLCGKPRLVFEFPWQDASEVTVYSDTDWAGCPVTRKSTSGGAIMLGKHLIKTWSSTQPSISLSSAEAEFYGLVKASGMGLGYRALLRDLGYELPVVVYTDSSAAMGICNRQGLGKLRHLDTHSLWVQQAVRTGRIVVRKVKGTENPADLFTKHIPTHEKIRELVRLFGCRYESGRAAAAPTLRRERLTKDVLADTYLCDGDVPLGNFERAVLVDTAPSALPGLLPHEHPSGELDAYFPKMPVPDDDEERHDDYVADDRLDGIDVAGTYEAEEIIRETLVWGRRRRPNGNV